MITIHLEGQGWARKGSTRARGYAHFQGRGVEADGIAELTDNAVDDETWRSLVASLNGSFAVVTERKDRILAAVDRVRSVPVFYTTHGSASYLSDNAYRVSQAAGRNEPNALAEAEFLLTGFVTGRETLCTDVLQIQAGQAVTIFKLQDRSVERHKYHSFRHREPLQLAQGELFAMLESVYSRVFGRLVESVRGRTIVVPLSGGYDSRLIGVSLRDLGVGNVVCYSYGVPGNWESRISQELAKYLGFRWVFVPYSAERWRAWAQTDHFQRYFHAAGNLVSVPHVQDWPAVWELAQKSEIPPDSVFVPGHSGDFLAGSHIPGWFIKRQIISRRELLDAILGAHYSLWEWDREKRDLREEFDRRIELVVGRLGDCPPALASDIFELWDLEERQAKFICNSVRVYESLGYDWRLPLFDHELMDLWARVPLGKRVSRNLYMEFARARQSLPVTAPNRDRNELAALILKGVERAGLRPLAKEIRRRARRWMWKRQYESSTLAWFALVDPGFFAKTYTGKEILHSYMAAGYRDFVRGRTESPLPLGFLGRKGGSPSKLINRPSQDGRLDSNMRGQDEEAGPSSL